MKGIDLWDQFFQEMIVLDFADEECIYYKEEDVWDIIDKYHKLFHAEKTPKKHHLCKDCKHFKKRDLSAWGECINPMPTREKKRKSRYGSDYGCVDFTEVTHGT